MTEPTEPTDATTSSRAIAMLVAQDLVDAGADAVVLVGSAARDVEHPGSDIDVVALGEGPEYSLRLCEGRLVSVSWAAADDVRAEFDSPTSAGAAVPAWRSAEILVDARLRAHALKQFAHDWRWARIDDACDAWIASEFPGYAEEVFRLAGLVDAGRELPAAVVRCVLALRMPTFVAVRYRVSYESENDLWDLIATELGDGWRADHRLALGLEREVDGRFASERAAFRLWIRVAAEVAGLINDDDRAVVDAATEVARRNA